MNCKQDYRIKFFMKFIVAWYDILYEINILSQLLQSPSFNLYLQMLKQMSSIKQFLQEYHSIKVFG